MSRPRRRRLLVLEEVDEGSMCSSEDPIQTDESFAVTVAIAVLQDRARMRRAVAIVRLRCAVPAVAANNKYGCCCAVPWLGQSFESHVHSYFLLRVVAN